MCKPVYYLLFASAILVGCGDGSSSSGGGVVKGKQPNCIEVDTTGRPDDNGTGIVTGRVRRDGNCNGQPAPIRIIRSNRPSLDVNAHGLNRDVNAQG